MVCALLDCSACATPALSSAGGVASYFVASCRAVLKATCSVRAALIRTEILAARTLPNGNASASVADEACESLVCVGSPTCRNDLPQRAIRSLAAEQTIGLSDTQCQHCGAIRERAAMVLHMPICTELAIGRLVRLQDLERTEFNGLTASVVGRESDGCDGRSATRIPVRCAVCIGTCMLCV